MKRYAFILIVLAVSALVLFLLTRGGGREFKLPRGEEVVLDERIDDNGREAAGEEGTPGQQPDANLSGNTEGINTFTRRSTRTAMKTDGRKHSIPLDEILSGGPGKDGIPSINNPKFTSAENATFLNNDDVGLGLEINGDARFYPYQILVWHEIANDTVGGTPALVTYCPLCATGVVFERRVDGKVREFGVSGLLWQSNLLMYNRTGDEDTESLWSQVLGEAVVGPETGAKLDILRSDTVRFGDWVEKHPDTKVLSRDTGASRNYGVDPYGNYYSSDSVGFGATFNDDRLHPKAFVFGIEINGKFKAYHREALSLGATQDTFAGKELEVEKSSAGEVVITASDGTEIPVIGGFWFSWLAVHPDTDLYK